MSVLISLRTCCAWYGLRWYQTHYVVCIVSVRCSGKRRLVLVTSGLYGPTRLRGVGRTAKLDDSESHLSGCKAELHACWLKGGFPSQDISRHLKASREISGDLGLAGSPPRVMGLSTWSGPSAGRPYTTKPAHGVSAAGELKPNLFPAGSPEHSSASVCSGSSCSGSGLQFGLGIGLGSGLGSGSGAASVRARDRARARAGVLGL